MRFSRICILTFLSFLFVCAAHAQVEEWRPVSQDELNAKTPKVEADADAEAIFWEVRLDDQKRKKMSYNHYVRVKIFTERGRERFSKFDIPFAKGKTVEDVAARVIKPDGSVVSVGVGDIFERDIVRAGKLVIRAKSFAVPGIEPGVIFEYQYKETFKGDSADNERLVFQRDIPIQRMTYMVRPFKGGVLRIAWRNMPDGRFVEAGEGFMSSTAENIPALREEPQMPPEDEVRQWALLNYSDAGFSWSMLAIGYRYYVEAVTRPDKEVLAKANEIVNGINDPEKQLRALFEFTQKRIRNVSYDRSITDDQREKIENKRASDTLKRGMGHAGDIDLLFASLARALGFSTEAILAGDRSVTFTDARTVSSARALHPAGILVSKGTFFLPCNPGTPFMPFGMIDWYEEGVYSLLVGTATTRWVKTNYTIPEKNLSVRTAKLKLNDDGSVEGFIRVQHNGHQATSRRRDLFLKSPAEREKLLIESWKETLGSAEISMFSFENFEDASRPYTYSFNVRVPNYAQRTGKRLFLQPNFFEYGTSSLFSSTTRKYSIYYDFGWSEEDTVEIELPKGFEADSIGEPNEINETNGLGRLTNYYTYDREKNIIKADRKFIFGTKGRLLFPVGAYQPLKTLFDLFHKADTHAIALKQKQ